MRERHVHFVRKRVFLFHHRLARVARTGQVSGNAMSADQRAKGSKLVTRVVGHCGRRRRERGKSVGRLLGALSVPGAATTKK